MNDDMDKHSLYVHIFFINLDVHRFSHLQNLNTCVSFLECHRM